MILTRSTVLLIRFISVRVRLIGKGTSCVLEGVGYAGGEGEGCVFVWI